MVLQCEAKGWYPEPEVFWLDGEGNLLSAGPPETVRGPDDLYTVSRRLTVEKSDSFTCRVQQKNIKQTRETHFNVPGRRVDLVRAEMEVSPSGQTFIFVFSSYQTSVSLSFLYFVQFSFGCVAALNRLSSHAGLKQQS